MTTPRAPAKRPPNSPVPQSEPGSRSLEHAPPASSVTNSTRGAIDTLVQGSLVDLMQAYDVAVAPSPRGRERELNLADTSATITFNYADGSRKSGRLTLSMPSAVLSTMRADVRNSDWARELANQLMGRIKNRLLQFNVKLSAGLPITVDSKVLLQQLQGISHLRSYTGRTMRGEVVVTIEGLPHDSELVYVGPVKVADEGEILFF